MDSVLVFFGLILAVTKPLGVTCTASSRGATRRSPQARAVERPLPALRRRSAQEQDWKEYTFALLAFSAFGVVVTYAIQRLQGHLPLNPQHFAGVEHDLAFNTAASFVTNTNWQSYPANRR